MNVPNTTRIVQNLRKRGSEFCSRFFDFDTNGTKFPSRINELLIRENNAINTGVLFVCEQSGLKYFAGHFDLNFEHPGFFNQGVKCGPCSRLVGKHPNGVTWIRVLDVGISGGFSIY